MLLSNPWRGFRANHPLLATLFCFFSIGLVSDRLTGQESDRIPHMTHEQEGKVRKLVARTQAAQSEIKKMLSAEHGKLGRLYGAFELDEKQIEAAHQAIGELEQKLLRTHLAMHRELRTFLGPEIFSDIVKRLKVVMDKQIPPVSKQSGPSAK